MWKPEHRIAAAERGCLRYPSDMSDLEWALVELMIPLAARRLPARCKGARSLERGLLCAGIRLSVASVAEGFASQKYGASLFHHVGSGWHVSAHS